MSQDERSEKKVAIVTGGSRGIGRAIVRMLGGAGYAVAFNYHQSKDAAAELEQELKKAGVPCQADCVDVKNFKEVKVWVESVKKNFGRLDVLVSNAGIIVDKALMLMTPEDWHKVIDTNLNGTFNVTRACIVTFMKQKSGDIVQVSSISGIIGLPRQTNYSASKGGINAFTKALAKEVAGYNIRVNAVAPGYIETDMLGNFSDEQKVEAIKKIPAGRVGSPEDVANCVKFLLSPQAQYLTGQIIPVDGGLAMR